MPMPVNTAVRAAVRSRGKPTPLDLGVLCLRAGAFTFLFPRTEYVAGSNFLGACRPLLVFITPLLFPGMDVDLMASLGDRGTDDASKKVLEELHDAGVCSRSVRAST